MAAPRDGFVGLAIVFRGLADPARLAIIDRLARGEASVGDLAKHVGLAQPTVSGHLAALRECGLVDVRRERTTSFYHLRQVAVLDVLVCARPLLADPYDPTTDTRARKRVRGSQPFQAPRGRAARDGGQARP